MPTFRQRLSATRGAIQAAVVDHAAHVLAKVRYSFPDAHPRKHDVVVHRDVAYAEPGDSAHRLDVYIPSRQPRPLPVVMYVHGGGFSMLSKDTHRVMALAFARRGYLTFNVNYRLSPRHRYPAALEDVCEALLWVQARCEEYGGDGARIAIAGESAGGNLVTALACASAIRRPEPFARRVFEAGVGLRAVVATYPFLDLTDIDRFLLHPRLSFVVKGTMHDAAVSYVGHDVHRVARRAPLCSPLLVIERAATTDRPLPAFFTNAGTRDPLLPQAKRLKAALDRLGVPCEMHVSPGELHGFDAMVWRRAAVVKWRRVYKFLEEHLESSPAPEARAPGLGAEN
jgi:acetyl esterase